MAADDVKMRVSGLDFYYGSKQALFGIGLQILTNRITALIGPSGCGKSTFLRTLNRMYETLPHARAEGAFGFSMRDVFYGKALLESPRDFHGCFAGWRRLTDGLKDIFAASKYASVESTIVPSKSRKYL